MQTLTDLAPAIEIYSIDEAFVNVSGSVTACRWTRSDTRCARRSLKHGFNRWRRHCPDKTLAKLANYAAKRWASTGGVVDLSGRERQRKLLAKVPVEEVWGVGRRITKN